MALNWYFDFISPFSYLHWRKLRRLPATTGLMPVPIVFGAVLQHWGQQGPAEIPRKRTFTYRHVLWRAEREGVPLRFPPAHPFNPIAALRLCIAAGNTPAAVDAIFDWFWRDGHEGDTPERLAPLAQALGIADIATAIARDNVKSQLRRNTGTAIAAGVFGVPTLAIGDDLYWGNDAHDFMMAVLADPSLLEQDEMRRVAVLPAAVQRDR